MMPERTAKLLVDHYGRLPAVIDQIVDDTRPTRDPFTPGFALPELDADVATFLSAATARWQGIAGYRGRRFVLLDLTGNPRTRTTKTVASLLIVARAVANIRRTGTPIVIFSPTSANKGTALRDAVLRAYEVGLVTPDQLRIVTLFPAGCRSKLTSGPMTDEPALRAGNPLLSYDGPEPDDVKKLGTAFVEQYAEAAKRRTGANLWYSLDLRNYLVADTTRAFFENEVDPPTQDARRLHVHAVSSAFGLLGYHTGREILEKAGEADPATRPGSLLVQHLNTPDMVVNLRHGEFHSGAVPEYKPDDTGLFRQSADPRFPSTTYHPAEVLDPTFYTRAPATSPAMNALIAQHGGDGIVVSLHECLERYPLIRTVLAAGARPLPEDPRSLREWSVVMAMTGVMNAIDRGLVDTFTDIVVHGSGWYASDEYTEPSRSDVIPVRTVEDIAEAVLG